MARHHTAIPKQHGQWEPENNWEPVGRAINGKQLWVERFQDNEPEPMMETIKGPDGTAIIDPETGEPKQRRVFKRHPVNGEPLYPMNRRNIVTRERMFYVESQGNWNVEKHFYTPPSEEELREIDRKERIQELKDTFFAKLADTGLSPDELMRRLQTYGPVMTDEQIAEADEHAGVVPEPAGDSADEKDYPLKLAGRNQWELSNGTIYTGDEEGALDAELEVLQRREEMASVPEF